MKRLVVFADGTWNKPDQVDRGQRRGSNIVLFARGLLPNAANGTPQVCHYDEGVGTHWGMDKVLGGGFGHGLSKNVLEAYRFLVHNYDDDDQIYLFGFSRGAYTVRSLAGLIDRMGILSKNNDFFTPDGYKLYREGASKEELKKFGNKNAARWARIRFLGVFDTVGALGIPVGLFTRLNRRRYEFHKVGLPESVDNAFQALAIDEQRKPFRPSIWPSAAQGQRMEQVWFSGVHTNIGGGYEKGGLSNITLHWMKDRAKECDLEFDEPFLEFYKPWFGDELRKSMTMFYRMMGKHRRPIGKMTDGNESVHQSVLDLRNHDATYRPKNLEEYLKNHQELLQPVDPDGEED